MTFSRIALWAWTPGPIHFFQNGFAISPSTSLDVGIRCEFQPRTVAVPPLAHKGVSCRAHWACATGEGPQREGILWKNRRESYPIGGERKRSDALLKGGVI